MNRTLAVAAAGMTTQQALLDSIAANLANLDVPGYRVTRTDFSAFMNANGKVVAPESGEAERLFTQGRLDLTDNPHDLAIDGDGFFPVITAQSKRAFTRAGNFSPDAYGRLRLPNGAMLEGVQLPAGTASFTVDEQGKVLALVAGRSGSTGAGRINLATFLNPAGLQLNTDGLFYQSSASGTAQAQPLSSGRGKIKQRYLERANVTVVAAMMAVLAAQRAYEANAKVVQAADEMLRLANNLERG